MNQTNTIISTVKMRIFLNHIHDCPKLLFSPLEPKNGTNTIRDFSLFYKKIWKFIKSLHCSKRTKTKNPEVSKVLPHPPSLSLSLCLLSLFPSFPLTQKSQISINNREMLIYFSEKEQFSLSKNILKRWQSTTAKEIQAKIINRCECQCVKTWWKTGHLHGLKVSLYK